MQQKIFNFIGRFVAKNWLFLIFLLIACFVRVFFNYKGQTDLFEFPFRAEVWGTFADWIGTFASILTLAVAAVALNSWKHPKFYDLEMKAKANAWRAFTYMVSFTAIPIDSIMLKGDFKERYENLIKESPELAHCYLEAFIVEIVRLTDEKTYIELNTIAEEVRHAFENTKDKNRARIFKFYSLFSSSYMQIWINANDIKDLKYSKYNGEEIDEEKLSSLQSFFHKGGRKAISNALGDALSSLSIR